MTQLLLQILNSKQTMNDLADTNETIEANVYTVTSDVGN